MIDRLPEEGKNKMKTAEVVEMQTIVYRRSLNCQEYH